MHSQIHTTEAQRRHVGGRSCKRYGKRKCPTPSSEPPDPKPQSTVMAPNQCDCNQLEASCIQQRRLKHAICKMHVKINNNNSMGGAEWEHKRSNPCCWQTGRLSLTQGWPRGSVTQEPEAGLEDKSRAQEPSRGQHQSTNQSLLILIFPHVF